MSPVRTHFCTLVARFHGAVSWPRKYGLNGTMPALTNSRFGSSYSRGELGTTAWPLLSKKRSQRRLISAVSMVWVSFGCGVLRRPGPGQARAQGYVATARQGRWRGPQPLPRSGRGRVVDQLLGLPGRERGAAGQRAGVDAERVAQLALALAHALTDGVGQLAQALAGVGEPAGEPAGQVGGRVGLGGLGHLADQQDAGRGAEGHPEESSHAAQPLRRRPRVDREEE